MFGFLVAIVSGVAMSIQGIFNTRLSEKIGTWETNLLVQGIGFLITLAIFLFLGHNNLRNIKNVNKLYLLGGVLAVIITYTVMASISTLGPTFAIATILVAQLLSAAIVEHLGLFDSTCCRFTANEFVGVFLMIAGIIVFKFLKF
ncbi:MAG: DMT family transporter [Clostridiaceae bacterium]